MSNLSCYRWSYRTPGHRPDGQSHSKLLLRFAALLLVAMPLTMSHAQEQTAQALAERSAVVVRGRVLKVNASDEAMLVASANTAVISVEQMYAGSEIAGDQRGRTITVILSRPDSVKPGEEAVFFGNPRFLGRTLTIADEGELSTKEGAPAMQSEMEGGSQARKEMPIRQQLATATLVFRGTVASVRPLETAAAEAGKPGTPPSEHDPEWQVAEVKIATPIRGGEAGQTVSVLFAASRDIEWFNAPKLKTGQDAVFLAHAADKENTTLTNNRAFAALAEKAPVYVVTQPFDVLPATDEERVKGMLTNSKETKQ